MRSDVEDSIVEQKRRPDLPTFNSQLIDRAGYTSDRTDVLAKTPYIKGYGFSVKLRYPEKVADRFSDLVRESSVFAFVRVSVFLPSDKSPDGRAVAFLDISPGKSGKDDEVSGLVSPIQHSESSLPLSVSSIFYFNPNVFEGLIESDGSNTLMSLQDACTELWEEHLAPTRMVRGCFLRLQLIGYKFLRTLQIYAVALIELCVWILSGQVFRITERSNDEGDGRSSKPADVKWLFEALQLPDVYVPYLSDRAPRDIVEPHSHDHVIEFYGMKVSPITGVWFYLIVFAFFGYRNLYQTVGEMEFINAYWNAILFFAPLVILGCAWLVPTVGLKLINYLVNRHLSGLFGPPKNMAIRAIIGVKVFWRSSETTLNRDHFEWN